MPIFQTSCSTVPYWRPVQGLFSQSSIIFNSSSAAVRSDSLFTRRFPDKYLSYKLFLSTLEISTLPQFIQQTQEVWVFSQTIWYFGGCAHWNGAQASSKTIQVIPDHLCFCTCINSFLYRYRTLRIFPVARNSSNSSFNTQDVMLINQFSSFVFA